MYNAQNMALILNGTSEINAHVSSYQYYLICLRHLIRSKGSNKSPKRPIFGVINPEMPRWMKGRGGYYPFCPPPSVRVGIICTYSGQGIKDCAEGPQENRL